MVITRTAILLVLCKTLLSGHNTPTHVAITAEALVYLAKVRPDRYANCAPFLLKLLAPDVVQEDTESFEGARLTTESFERGVLITDESGVEIYPSFNRFMFHFTPELKGSGLGRFAQPKADCSSYQWAFEKDKTCTHNVRPGMIPAVSSYSLKNDHTYLHAAATAATNPDGAIRTFGRVLHLIQDLTSPAHTRADRHPHLDEMTLNPSKAAAARKLLYTDPIAYINAVPDKDRNFFSQADWLEIPTRIPREPTAAIFNDLRPQFDKVEKLFAQLQAYVSSEFYSKDTLETGPEACVHAACLVLGTFWWDDATTSRVLASKSNEFLSMTLQERLEAVANDGWRKYAQIDHAAADEQWKELGPLAVLYSAIALDLFIEENNIRFKCTPSSVPGCIILRGSVTPPDGTPKPAMFRIVADPKVAIVPPGVGNLGVYFPGSPGGGDVKAEFGDETYSSGGSAAVGLLGLPALFFSIPTPDEPGNFHAVLSGWLGNKPTEYLPSTIIRNFEIDVTLEGSVKGFPSISEVFKEPWKRGRFTFLPPAGKVGQPAWRGTLDGVDPCSI